MIYSYSNSTNSSSQQKQQQQPTNTFFFSLSPTQSYHEDIEVTTSAAATNTTNSSPTTLNTTPLSTFDYYYQKQKLNSQQNYPTCRVVSTVSDYRLTLTDFIDLNLLDTKTGLIINPLNGDRLTLHEAIKLELINSDVKEIANVYDSCNSKLTIKEAISLQLIDSFKNEFIIKNYKRMSFYEARERNLILKPLTLSEAFMFNLIEPNGYVKNPLNHEYILFDQLINPRVNYGLFDLDTKHIIDPNRKHKLLSINEAIDTNLILPKTFEINLIREMIDAETLNAIKIWSPLFNVNTANIRINLYDAFFNIKNLNLNLLLYKPEIENVYIKINQQRQPYTQKANKYLRTSIGLLEAINYKVIDLTKEIYYFTYPTSFTTFSEALKDELIDYELIDILNTKIGSQRHGAPIKIKDCLNDYTLYLEKCLFKNPFSNEYLHLESFACKSLLSESMIRLIKNLITRINIKNYLISFNDTTTTPSTSNNSVKSNETRTLAIETIKDAQTNRLYTINDALSNGLLDKSTLCYQNMKTGHSISLNDAHEQGLVNGSFYYNNKDFEKTEKCQNGKIEMEKHLFEDLSYQIKYIIDPDTNTKLNLDDAIRLGVFDRKKGLYINKKTGKTMNLNEAVNKGFIEVQTIDTNKDSILKIDISGLTNSNMDADNDSVLYEVNEINQTTILPHMSDLQAKFLAASTPRVQNEQLYTSIHVSNSSSSSERTNMIRLPERIENIIDEEEEIMKSNVKIEKRVPKNGVGYKKNIIERQCIQSVYGEQSLETLVIDDVRRSALLNIEGETHIHKNEIIIESPKQQSMKTSHRSFIDINTSLPIVNSSKIYKIREEFEVAADEKFNDVRNEIVIDDYNYESSNKMSNKSSKKNLAVNIIDINHESEMKMHFTSYSGQEKLIIKESELNSLKPTGKESNSNDLISNIKLRQSNQNVSNRTVIIVEDNLIKCSVKERAELFEKKIKTQKKSSSTSSSENDSPKKVNKDNLSKSSPISTLSSASSLSSNQESVSSQSNLNDNKNQQFESYNYSGKKNLILK